MSTPASVKQAEFIRRLVTERFGQLNTAGKFETVGAMLAAMDPDAMSKHDAGKVITRLMAMNADPDPTAPVVVGAQRMSKGNKYANPCNKCGHVVPVGEGYFFLLDGKWGTIHAINGCDFTPVEGIDLGNTPAGMYAVPDGETRLKVRIDRPTAGRWEGWTFVKDGASYGHGGMLGKAAPGQPYVGQAMEAVRAIVLDPVAAAAAYGHLTGKCGICGRKLEDATSVARGIGPVCFGKF